MTTSTHAKTIRLVVTCVWLIGIAIHQTTAGEPASPESRSITEPQRIFYSPTVEKTGYMWDVWVHHHEGRYYLYYLSGSQDGRGFDNISLAISEDGVFWREHGVVVPLSETARGMGSCGVWESKSKGLPKFLMNLMEFRPERGKVMFTLGSEDLVQWEDLGEKYTFGPDPRWYVLRLLDCHAEGRRASSLRIRPQQGWGDLGDAATTGGFGHGARLAARAGWRGEDR